MAHLSDTGFEELQTTRLENLDKARHSEHPAYPLAGHMFTVAGEVSPERLREAIPAAIERAARAMVEPEFRDFSGLDAVRRLAEEAGSWPEVAEDWQWCARFGYQVIERRGTGGGAFRLMYSRFLDEAGRPEAPLAADAAAAWTDLANAFHAASEHDEPEAGPLAPDRHDGQPRSRGGGAPLDLFGQSVVIPDGARVAPWCTVFNCGRRVVQF